MATSRARARLRNTASIIAYVVLAQTATAQEAEFLGTVQLGDSKRDVQTDTATPITVVDQDEINDRQADTIAELIDSVPGVSLVNGSTPQGSGINIRGYGANSVYGTDQKVAVIVDGASVGSEELYRIGTQLFTDPALFRSVEVIRGTVGSFAYGSGIVGGLVQLETVDASDFTNGEVGFNVRQTLQFSSNGDGIASSTILAWQPTENLEFLANLTTREQDDQIDGAGDTIGASAFDLPTGLIKGRYSFGQNSDQSLTFSYNTTVTDENDVPYDTFDTTGGTFGNVDRETQSDTASLQYAYAPIGNDLVDLTVTLSYASDQIDQEYVDGSSTCEADPALCPSPFPDGGFLTVNADHKYETTKLNVSNTSLFDTGSVNHSLLAGVELIRKERLDANSAPGGTDNRIAVFVVDEMEIGDSLSITPALRYETSSIEGSTASNDRSFENDALMGGLSVRYAFGDGFAVFGSAAYTESLPIIDDLDSTELMEQSEKSTTYEIGGSYNQIDVFASGDELSFKTNIYQTTTDDITSYTVEGQRGVIPDRVETEGVEIEGSYTLESGYYMDANANFVEGTEFRKDGTTADWRNVPANSIGLTLGRKFGRELDLSWEIIADAEIKRNDETTDAFAVHNVRATYIPQSGILTDTEIRLGIENLADLDYTSSLATRPAPGRNVKLTVSRTF
ncbi:TonB-dependent receptor domain-containing protein [Loktanella agnita]|uniref:TonB-dependent receptor domain-containing protein n=1 Tax=Loktanella agnita TaxID=287097 RepID=UPI003985A6DF